MLHYMTMGLCKCDQGKDLERRGLFGIVWMHWLSSQNSLQEKLEEEEM